MFGVNGNLTHHKVYCRKPVLNVNIFVYMLHSQLNPSRDGKCYYGVAESVYILYVPVNVDIKYCYTYITTTG